MSERTCKRCGEPIPPGKRRDAVYCSRNCQQRYWEEVVEPRPHCVDCRAPLGIRSRGRSKRCLSCDYARRAERYRVIERLWAEGRTIREIAERLGTTKGAVGVAMNRMREQGYDLPYREATFPTGKPRFPDQVAA